MERTEYGSMIDRADPGEPSTHAPRISVTEGEAELLTYLAEGKDVLEIGTGLAISTMAFVQSARSIVTIDIDPWIHEHIWPGLPPCVQTWKSRSPDDTFDFVFIDGAHDTKSVKTDLKYARMVCPRGMIVAHDAHHDGVALALDNSFHSIDTYHGIAISYQGWTA